MLARGRAWQRLMRAVGAQDRQRTSEGGEALRYDEATTAGAGFAREVAQLFMAGRRGSVDLGGPSRPALSGMLWRPSEVSRFTCLDTLPVANSPEPGGMGCVAIGGHARTCQCGSAQLPSHSVL